MTGHRLWSEVKEDLMRSDTDYDRHNPSRWQEERGGRGIALLVPFRPDTEDRQVIWDWMKKYYLYHLPYATLIEGTDHGTPFSKTCAMNEAARNSPDDCDVFVLLDADCYIPIERILTAARRIRLERELGQRRWYIPYRKFLRLNHRATVELLESDPHRPWREPEDCDVENQDGSECGHWYGALIMIVPREAYEEVGGMDPRCRGWGCDDITFAMALDTLYTKHRTLHGSVVTVDHVVYGERFHRMWAGQDRPNVNGNLGTRYRRAWGNPEAMRSLVDEWRVGDADHR